jgi:pimeloyl-ACP methyl ester carboxylesterase
VMVDMPFFGESQWVDENDPILPSDWDDFLKQLLLRFPSESLHFLAFSLGAKVAMGLYQATEIDVRSMILISPDGLRIHWLYRFCIYNPVGKALFYTVLRWPRLFLGLMKLLYKLRITDPFKYIFVKRQFDTPEKRSMLRRVWRGYAKIRPDTTTIATRSAATGTVWHIIWGASDNVLPVNLCKDFIQKVKDAKLHVVQGGHFLLNPPQDEVKSLLNAILDV